MLSDSPDDPGATLLPPEEVDRLLTAAFMRAAPQAPVDPDRPVLEDARLEVRERLGHGGLGAVYLCRDRRMKREVALKILRSKHTGNLLARDGLLWEARLGSRLDHPGILPVHEIGVDRTGRPFFTMRVVRGRTLRDVLLTERTGDAGRARLLRALLQIAEAVAHAHASGVVHSDLKPENTMIGAHGEVLVLDWGLARSLDADDDVRPSSSSSKAGTPAYMAPERAQPSSPPLAPTADVFALGVMLLEVLTGPEAGATTVDATAAAGSGANLSTRLGGGDPVELTALARDSVATSPEDRPRDAAAFGERLAAALEHIEEDARQARLEAAAASARAAAERRARRTVQGLSLAVLLSAGFAGAIWLRTDRAREQRRASTVIAVQDALDESRALTAGLDPVTSLGLLREASERLALTADSLDAELLPPEWSLRLEARRGELAAQVTAAEEQAEEHRWREELRAALGAARLRGLAGVHSTSLGRAYASAFEAADLNPLATTVEELRSPYPLDGLLSEIVGALDIWAMFGLDQNSMAAEEESRRLRNLVQELDPMPDRRAVRAAALAGDDETLERFAQALSDTPFQSPTTYVLLGGAFAGQDGLARAHSVWREGCFEFPDDPWCHVLLGYDWEKIGIASAREHLWAGVALEPANPSPWTNLAVSYIQTDRMEDALRAFRHVAKLEPDSATAHFNYWKVQFDLGRYDGALVSALRRREIRPDELKSSDIVVRTLIALGRTEEAREEQELLAERWWEEGGEEGASTILAEALWRTGALEDARRAYAPREDTPPAELAKRRYSLGEIAMEDGEFEEALGHFEEILHDATYGPRALAMQGLALVYLERPAEGYELLERAHALGADMPTWKVPLAEVLAMVAEDLRLDAVIAGEAHTDDAPELARAGRRALERGDAARAFELYELAFEPDMGAAGAMVTEGVDAALRALAVLEADGGALESEPAERYRMTVADWLRFHFESLAQRHAAGLETQPWLDDLRTWGTRPDFAPLRDPAPLARLPAAERETWRALWSDVREFLEAVDEER